MIIEGEVALRCSDQYLNRLDLSMTSCPPLIVNSQRITCRLQHIASGLHQSLAPRRGNQRRSAVNKLFSLAVHTAPPGCRLQPSPHCSAPPPTRGWCSCQGQRVRHAVMTKTCIWIGFLILILGSAAALFLFIMLVPMATLRSQSFCSK